MGAEAGQTGMELLWGVRCFTNAKRWGLHNAEWSECYRMVHVEKLRGPVISKENQARFHPRAAASGDLGCDQEFAFLTGAQVACENHWETETWVS